MLLDESWDFHAELPSIQTLAMIALRMHRF